MFCVGFACILVEISGSEVDKMVPDAKSQLLNVVQSLCNTLQSPGYAKLTRDLHDDMEVTSCLSVEALDALERRILSTDSHGLVHTASCTSPTACERRLTM